MADITAFLWFDNRAEEAMEFYASTFADSEIVSVNNVDGPDLPGGALRLSSIRTETQTIMLINGDPSHVLNQAFSLFLSCKDQREVDYFWDAICEGAIRPLRMGHRPLWRDLAGHSTLAGRSDGRTRFALGLACVTHC